MLPRIQLVEPTGNNNLNTADRGKGSPGSGGPSRVNPSPTPTIETRGSGNGGSTPNANCAGAVKPDSFGKCPSGYELDSCFASVGVPAFCNNNSDCPDDCYCTSNTTGVGSSGGFDGDCLICCPITTTSPTSPITPPPFSLCPEGEELTECGEACYYGPNGEGAGVGPANGCTSDCFCMPDLGGVIGNWSGQGKCFKCTPIPIEPPTFSLCPDGTDPIPCGNQIRNQFVQDKCSYGINGEGAGFNPNNGCPSDCMCLPDLGGVIGSWAGEGACFKCLEPPTPPPSPDVIDTVLVRVIIRTIKIGCDLTQTTRVTRLEYAAGTQITPPLIPGYQFTDGPTVINVTAKHSADGMRANWTYKEINCVEPPPPEADSAELRILSILAECDGTTTSRVNRNTYAVGTVVTPLTYDGYRLVGGPSSVTITALQGTGGLNVTWRYQRIDCDEPTPSPTPPPRSPFAPPPPSRPAPPPPPPTRTPPEPSRVPRARLRVELVIDCVDDPNSVSPTAMVEKVEETTPTGDDIPILPPVLPPTVGPDLTGDTVTPIVLPKRPPPVIVIDPPPHSSDEWDKGGFDDKMGGRGKYSQREDGKAELLDSTIKVHRKPKPQRNKEKSQFSRQIKINIPEKSHAGKLKIPRPKLENKFGKGKISIGVGTGKPTTHIVVSENKEKTTKEIFDEYKQEIRRRVQRRVTPKNMTKKPLKVSRDRVTKTKAIGGIFAKGDNSSAVERIASDNIRVTEDVLVIPGKIYTLAPGKYKISFSDVNSPNSFYQYSTPAPIYVTLKDGDYKTVSVKYTCELSNLSYWLKPINRSYEKIPTKTIKGLFSDDVKNLITYFTSSNGAPVDNYYTHVYNRHPVSGVTSSIAFSVAYGHYHGSGSVDDGGQVNDTATRAVYAQYRNIILSGSKQKFNVAGKETDSIYVFNYQKGRVEQELDVNAFEINMRFLSGSEFISGSGTMATHTSSNVTFGDTDQVLRVITDYVASVDENPTYTLGGRVYNLVSGSIEQGIHSPSAPHYYGKLYPNLRVAILDGTKLDLSASFGTVLSSDTAGDNTMKMFTSISGAALLSDASGDEYGMKGRVVITDYNSYYFMTAMNYEFNHSNNSSYVSGSDAQIFDATFKEKPKTYITTIGLYNDNRELLAVGKLSIPILKTQLDEANLTVKI